jgi:hypothetical protein
VSATTGTLVLATDLGLSADVGSGVLAMETTEVTEDLAGMTGTLEENGGLTSGTLKGELVEGQNATTGLDDASTGSLGNAESAHVDLGDLQETGVVSDGANNDGNILGVLTLQVLADLGERDGGSVDAGHAESLEHDLVELRLSSAGQELVQLQNSVPFIRVSLASSIIIHNFFTSTI